MQVEQTNLLDSLGSVSSENKKGIANYILDGEDSVGMAKISGEVYHKDHSKKVTSSGSFYMGDATYLKPNQGNEKQTAAEKLEEQKDRDAKTRYNEVAVVANTTTPEDCAKMQEDGFSVNDMDSRTIITVTDKIKAVLAKAGVDISIYGDSMSEEELQKITGNVAVARQIEAKLKENDLPATEENMKEAMNAYEQASQLHEMNDHTFGYLLKNELDPTIHNLYLAEYIFTDLTDRNMDDFLGTLSEDDYSKLQTQIERVIKEAGMSVNDETMEDSHWMVEQGILLTGKNLQYLQDLKQLSVQLDDEIEADSELSMKIVDSIVTAMAEGNHALDGMMIDSYSMKEKAMDSMNVIQKATDDDIAYVVSRGKELTIEQLREAELYREAVPKEDSQSAFSEEQISMVSAKRQLEETRLMMTVEANYSLLKKGISIDIKPLVSLVEDLKEQENQYYRSLMEQAGVETDNTNLSIYKETTETISDLKNVPVYILSFNSNKDTLQILHQSGMEMKESFDKAQKSYETLMTVPRSDMGDSIQKAFRNVDDILKDLNMDTTESNRRAVRILAYNQEEITAEHVTEIKAKDEEVQRVFRNMTPQVTIEMIRRNINPLDMEIGDLNHAAETIRSEIGNTDSERFSKYLWKLEQNHDITQEERESYIGIYRLIAQVEKSDGAVIGAVAERGAEITMRNLLSAVRTSQKHHMDYQVDDSFEGVDVVNHSPRIDEQLEMAFQQNCIKDVAEYVTPEMVQDLQENQWEDMSPEQLKEFIWKEQSDNDQAYYEEQLHMCQEALTASEDIYSYLEQNQIPNSVNNIIAVKEMFRNPNQMFATLFSPKGDSFDKKQAVKELKDMVLERFGEAIKTPEELAEAQETLAEVAEHAMDDMILEQDSVSTLDIRRLQLMNRQFTICAQQSKEESYMIPVQTGDSITGVSLKIVRGTKKKGFVDILFENEKIGKVAASFHAKEQGISGMVATDRKDTKQLFSDHLETLCEQLRSEEEEEVDIRTALVKDLSLEQYAMHAEDRNMKKGSIGRADLFDSQEEAAEEETVSVQTKRLYHIAESFVRMITNMGE